MLIVLMSCLLGPMMLDQAKDAVTGPPGKGVVAGGYPASTRGKSLFRVL